MERYFIVHGDKTTVDGVVLALLNPATDSGRNIAVAGDSVLCPKCNTTGRIFPTGPRLPLTFYGNEVALHGDLCLCKCEPPPRLIASLGNARMITESEGIGSQGTGPRPSDISTAQDTHPKKFDQHFQLHDEKTGEPLKNRFYKIHYSSGVIEGNTDDSGFTKKIASDKAEEVKIEIFGEGV
ncbi:PAAR domain-containing protein [Glaciimonas soli]|uniref:PAAR domain-containing protein n=1 Tax=Glaciimonas soli TaxID=2590999 RepID=A0A843YT44_9BURK|nr:PAAR domain-containing protein [Glaciimonas soli]MQR02360.1 hypothetical protein [Glaciimonas soli]